MHAAVYMICFLLVVYLSLASNKIGTVMKGNTVVIIIRSGCPQHCRGPQDN